MNQRLATSTTSVKSALRVLQILEVLTREGRPFQFSDFQEALGYPKASLHALLRTMTAARWLQFDEEEKTYRLGVRAWESGVAYSAMEPIEAQARPYLERVRDLTTETVQLAVLDDFEVLYVDKVEGQHMLRLDSSVGLRLEPHATGVGKILLAGLPEESVVDWVKGRRLERYTPNTITRSARLLRELEDVRERGYAFDDEERTLGAACVAVGIRNHSGACIAAMSVSAPAVRFGRSQRAAALKHLNAAAGDLSSALGYRNTDPSQAQRGRNHGKP
ncbi:IclR family transcriptional regulator [Bauldia sp.]|uniref:IclR family transcriptional regulator n=1 Tax=Bauldia sp. TaxID=2575872 RepID=UPI003BABB898